MKVTLALIIGGSQLFSILFVCKLELYAYCTIIYLEFNRRLSLAAFF